MHPSKLKDSQELIILKIETLRDISRLEHHLVSPETLLIDAILFISVLNNFGKS